MDRERRDAEDRDDSQPLTGQEQYNLVTDLVTGPNLRWRDNLIQGIIVLAFAVTGLWAGPVLLHGDLLILGIVGGLVLGLLSGALASGFALMIFRAVRHAQGKHD